MSDGADLRELIGGPRCGDRVVVRDGWAPRVLAMPHMGPEERPKVAEGWYGKVGEVRVPQTAMYALCGDCGDYHYEGSNHGHEGEREGRREGLAGDS